MPFSFDHCPDPILQHESVHQDYAIHLLMTVLLMPPKARDDSGGKMFSALRYWGAVSSLAPPDTRVDVMRYEVLNSSSTSTRAKTWLGVRLNGKFYRITGHPVPRDKRGDLISILRNAGFPAAAPHLLQYAAVSIRNSNWASKAPARPNADSGPSMVGLPMSGSSNPAIINPPDNTGFYGWVDPEEDNYNNVGDNTGFYGWVDVEEDNYNNV